MVAEDILELIGNIYLLAFIVINHPEYTVAVFLVLQHPRQSELLDQLVDLFIHVRRRPVDRLSELIPGAADRYLYLAIPGLAVLQPLHVIAVKSKPLEVRELWGIAKLPGGQVFDVTQTIEVTPELNVTFRGRVNVDHSKNENLGRAARFHSLDKRASVPDGGNLILA